MQNALKKEEIQLMLQGYPTSQGAITDELIRIADLLFAEAAERGRDLEAKATAIIGYSGAVAALLQVDTMWTICPLGRAALALAAVLAVGAIFAAFLTLRVRSWKWFSDKMWFKQNAMVDAETLRRYHLLAQHDIYGQTAAALKVKGRRLEVAQYLVAGAAASVAVALLLRAAAIAPS